MKKTLNLTRGLEVRGKYSNIDFLYGPYRNKAEACNRININIREKGLTVGIIEQGSVVEYWWRDATSDNDLIVKNPSKELVSDLQDRVTSLEENVIDEEQVTEWGFTKNKGTVTEVRINGQNIEPSTDGLIDLGMVDVIQADSKLPDDYKMSSLSNNDLSLVPGESHNSAFSKLEKAINDDEEVIAAAFNDLNNRLNNLGDLSITENYQPSSSSNNDLDIQTGDKYEQVFGKLEKKIQDNEEIAAASLNDLNNRLNNILNIINRLPTYYTITFNTNGGKPISELIVTEGFSFVLPTAEWIDNTMIFDGWYDNPNYTGNKYSGTYVSNRDITFYAKWKLKNQYKYYLSNTIPTNVPSYNNSMSNTILLSNLVGWNDWKGKSDLYIIVPAVSGKTRITDYIDILDQFNLSILDDFEIITSSLQDIIIIKLSGFSPLDDSDQNAKLIIK